MLRRLVASPVVLLLLTGGMALAEPLTPDEFREVIGHFATGVTVITTTEAGRPLGTTASAVTSLSLEPPMILVCMNKESATGRAMAASGRVAVNILGARQEEIALRFARRGANHFDGLPLLYGDEGVHAVPVVPDALAHLECTIDRELAETVSVHADPSPPPRVALPEQLVISKDRYGR